MARSLLVAAAVAAVLALAAVTSLALFLGGHDSPSGLSFQLAHTSLHIRASSFAAAGEPQSNANHLRDAAAAAAAAAASSPDEEQELSDHVFHKTKFALHGSHASASSASFSVRSLGAQQGDKQFFVRFSTRCDVRTLVALHKFTGNRVVAHVEGGLYVAIGGEGFADKARRFPGVAWVQEREGWSKVGSMLQQLLKETEEPGVSRVEERSAPNTRSGGDGVTNLVEVVAECWYDGCGAAAVAVRSVCLDVYVHPTLVEAHCSARALHAAVTVLSQHIGVDHVDVKPVAVALNFGGRAIIGTGPSATTPDASLVLSNINVSASVIAVADSGIDMNSCFFYDADAGSNWSNSRVVQAYVVPPCEMCGRCCGSQSGPNCSSDKNACGNLLDQSGHGTHVCGTVAGAGPANVSYGNGAASGAKIFFQDIENFLSNQLCFRSNGCLAGLSTPTDLLNLFTPAFNAGARVHSNSWGGQARGGYNIQSKAVDAFTSSNPTFLILFAAGNQGAQAVTGTIVPPGTCKNCLTVGASQQSDALFRSMQPYVDDGLFCPPANNSRVTDPCCSNPLSCVNRCCNWTSPLNASLACCANQTTCGSSGSCSVASGNLRSSTNIAAFSSRGPTLDGRFKPDLVAPGEDILSAATPKQDVPGRFTPTTAKHCVVPSQTQARSASDNFNRALEIKSGTSMATPLMAGAVEKIRQYFVQGYYPDGVRGTGTAFEPEEAMVRAVVLASCASVLADPQAWGVWSQRLPTLPGFFRFPIPPAHSPNIFQGFGLPVLDQAVHMAGSTNGYLMRFTNGTFSPSSSAAAYNISCQPLHPIPLTLVLVWTDPPGSVSSQKQLVNDLDLLVLVHDSSSSSTPSQLFGNMRAFADQSNTVERVVVQCPAAGVVTAVVAAGDSLKTSSQAWYLVANGPLSGITATSLPPYSRGRVDGPVTQSQACTFDAGITATVKFKPSFAWSCVGLIGSWDCSVKRQAFVMSLAQVVGVALQGVSVVSSGSTGLTMTLQCSAMINTWQSATSASLQYVTAMTLQKAISSVCNAASSACEADAALNVFDWSTFASVAPAAARVSISVTAFNNKNCTNMSSTFGTAPNPFVFTDQACFPGPIVPPTQLFLKALSCGTNVTFQRSPNDPSCVGNQLQRITVVKGACLIEDLNSPALPVSFMYTCNELPSSASDGTCNNGKLCLLVSDAAFYAILAVVLVHVLQAAAWAVVSKRKRLFSAGRFLVVLFVPVVGLVMWLQVCRSPAVTQRQETLLSDMRRAPQERE